MQDTEPPPVVKDNYFKWWWVVCGVFAVVCVGRLMGADFLGGVVSGLVTFWIYYMAKENCSKMSQYCLLMFGLMCTMNALFETIALAGSVAGRTSRHTDKTLSPDDPTKTVYTVTVEKHPFFDNSQGQQYNIQSAVMIASPVAQVMGATLAYYSYMAFTTSLFPDDDDQGIMGGGLGGGYGGVGSWSNTRANNAPAPGPAGVHSSGYRGPSLFEGSGQRLGSG